MKDRDHLAHRVLDAIIGPNSTPHEALWLLLAPAKAAALLEQAAGNAALHKLELWPDHVEGAAGAIKILLSIAAELADAIPGDAEASPFREPAEPLRSPGEAPP
jgi:hypothetical protein